MRQGVEALTWHQADRQVLDATPYLLQWLKKIVAHVYTDKTDLYPKTISIIGFIGVNQGYR